MNNQFLFNKCKINELYANVTKGKQCHSTAVTKRTIYNIKEFKLVTNVCLHQM